MINLLHKLAKIIGWSVFILVSFTCVVSGAYHLAYRDKALPRTFVGGVEVTNMTEGEIKLYLTRVFERNPNITLVMDSDQKIADTKSLGVSQDLKWASRLALASGRSGNILTQISERVRMFFYGQDNPLPLVYSSDDMDGLVNRVTGKLNREGVEARLELAKEDGEVRVVFKQGVDGRVVDEQALRKSILLAMGRPGEQKIIPELRIKNQTVGESRTRAAVATGEYWADKELVLNYKNYKYKLRPELILSLVDLGIGDKRVEYQKIVDEIKRDIEVKARDAVLQFDQGKVVEFSPEREGVEVKEDETIENLKTIIERASSTEMEISVVITKPKITVGEINNLGIKELIGVGASRFLGSIPNRIHNLTLASSRLNGVVVAPGETFSMNGALGEVSRATGYREAYVISQGRTVLGDGGGVCQTSTTMFRAALNAGLPIVERKSHAYRVHYYEDDMGPGYDSTVFNPSVDLKFINDTPAHILIQTKVDQKNFSLRYEFYGTKDDRVVNISKARFLSQSPALGTIYQDDPTLPEGTLRQVDWSAPGAKVSFDYKVTRGDETLQDKTFVSSYQPWAAVYLRGTGPK